MSSPVVFVDTETTSLDPDTGQIWEVGLLVDDTEHHWFLPVDLGRADPVALKIGRFHERYPAGDRQMNADRYDIDPTGPGLDEQRSFARDFAQLTAGRHLAGAVVSFDEERLRKLLRANGACPDWHYHLVDVEALAAGHVAATGPVAVKDRTGNTVTVTGRPPWDSNALSRAVFVDPDNYDRHTALGDARWAQAIYRAVMGGDSR